MIMVGVEPADHQELFEMFELALHEAVFPLGAGLRSQTAVGVNEVRRCCEAMTAIS
jgi:hypothetical protein